MHRLASVFPDPERRVVALLTASFFCLGAAFALLVPMFGNFDEQTHLDRARYTARHPLEEVGPELRRTSASWAALGAVDAARRAPPDDPVAYRQEYLRFVDYPGGNEQLSSNCPGLCQNIQYPHPPGWYLLTAPITAALDGRPFPYTVLALRLFDLLLVSPVVVLAWLTTREIWQGSPRRRLATTAAVALMGPLAYSASAINNDALLFLAMGAAIYLAAKILRRGASTITAGWLGVWVTVGLLTKVQMVLAAPAFGMAVVLAPASARMRLRSAAVFGFAALPGAGWWLRSLLSSNPLAPEGTELLARPVPGPWSDEGYLEYAFRKVPQLIARFWGTYDAPVTFAPVVVQVVCGSAVGALVAGWLIARRWTVPTVAHLRSLVLAAVPTGLLVGVLQASVSGYRRKGELRALAPRYLYPAMPLLAIGAVAATVVVARRWEGRVPRWGLPLVVAIGGMMAAASLDQAVRGAYGHVSWLEVFDRARAVGPSGRVAPVVLLLGVLWVCALSGAAHQAARSMQGAEEPHG